jgi:hypothetical protein
VAINVEDAEQVTSKFLTENKITVKVPLAATAAPGLANTYGILALPTSYLLGPDGTVLWQGVGFNEAAIRRQLEQLGIRTP